ncbi:MAG: MBL fold metallo-hydrolase [Oscillospiraceae bacterium]|jgi:phosphoribosyl 1,2-cyclic phosphodiesterase|nr:MBL fold metallo-hydrolase [Oscillospiraceae bacterium]
MHIITIASGSGGNCALVRDSGTAVLIDAGISARRIVTALRGLGLSPGQLSGILITHEHTDHVCGLAALLKNHEIPIFAPRTVANHLSWSIAGVDDYITVLPPGQDHRVGTLRVLPFRTPHDTPESVGYRLQGSGSLGFCTDFGHVTDEIREGLRGVDTAVIEANHDLDMLRAGPYPVYLKRRILSDNGHLSNTACGALACELYRNGTKTLVLAHLSRENNRPALARSAILDALSRQGADTGGMPVLEVAPEKEPLHVSPWAKVPC